MSVAGIASTLFSQITSQQSNRKTCAQNEFQQLSQDLQAGNLSQAQTDFAALQQNAPTGGSSPLSQAFSALGQDLKSGNLTGAQQDFASIQQDIQQAGQFHRHHHHSAGPQNPNPASSPENAIAQLSSSLGLNLQSSNLQSGNLATAQQAYASLQQELQQFSTSGSAVAAPLQVSA